MPLGEPLDGRDRRPDPPCHDLTDLFFSNAKADLAEAKAICVERCPYRDGCLNMALNDTRPVFGVWAGYDERELRRLRARRHLQVVR